MQYTRIYSEKNGDSRFAEANLTISEPDYQPPAPTLFVEGCSRAVCSSV
jgi:hypothetical protein